MGGGGGGGGSCDDAPGPVRGGGGERERERDILNKGHMYVHSSSFKFCVVCEQENEGFLMR